MLLITALKDHALAQNSLLNKPVTLEFDSLKLDKALDRLATQCECYFTYDSKLVKGDKRVSGQFYNDPLQKVLSLILKDTSLVFSEYKNQVVIQSQTTHIVQHQGFDAHDTFFNVSGQVVDVLNKKPLAYASVALVKTNLGTVTNDKGEFRLTLHDSLKQSEIVVSYIGYYNGSLPIWQTIKDTVIALKPAQVAIQEIIVRNSTGRYLVEKAIENIKKNYHCNAYSFDAFYRESIKAGTEYKNYSEAFLSGYKPPLMQPSVDTRFKLVSGRVFKSQKNNDTLLIKLSGGMDACNQLDIVHHKADFFDTPTLSLYHYTTSDIIIWNDELVYVVEFKPVSMSSDAWYEGKLYITQNSFALICAEFKFLNEKLARESRLFIAHKTRTIRAKPILTDYRIVYTSQNKRYYPHHIRGGISVNVKQRKSWFTQNYNMFYEMVYTQIDTANLSKPTFTESIRTKSIFSEYLYDYTSDGYWEKINIIKPEDDIMQALSKHGLTIQEEFMQSTKP